MNMLISVLMVNLLTSLLINLMMNLINLMNLISYRKLYKLPHWVNEKDLDILANKIAEQDDNTRASVKYLAAPGAGKTCAVLPAFLRCAERHGFTQVLFF